MAPYPPFPLLLALTVVLSASAGPTPLPDDPACTAADRVFMARAFELARQGVASGNGPFGAVLVKDGRVIAEYHNQVRTTTNVTQHAETGLIATFSPRMDRATFAASTLYASSEPCTMCCGSIRFAGIGRVVYGVTESQFERIITGTDETNHLGSKEVFARTAPQVTVLGPLMEAEGLMEHEKYRPTHPNPSRPKKSILTTP
jgi:tRNA(Arg) A34 adenosine deaminase TadA